MAAIQPRQYHAGRGQNNAGEQSSQTQAEQCPDERPHPYIVSLLREYAEEVYFTDAVEIPGLVEPEFHRSVHLEVE